MTPQQYCQQKAAGSGSSFYYSFRFLPPPKRLAITALYAFCREVDDVVDECTSTDIAAGKLDWWREEIARLFAGQPQHPVGQALAPVIERFRLPEEHFVEVLDGMRMDLDYDAYPSFRELRLYCHRVAGVVGLMSAEIFGYEDRQTLRYAAELGLALQLTNILRDVREDARRGRVYLPQDELQRFGVNPQELLQGRTSAALRELFAFQAQRARDTYNHALELLPDTDRRAQRTGLIMAAVYLALLEEIERDGFRVLEHRVSLTPLRKLLIAWRTDRRERRAARRLSDQG